MRRWLHKFEIREGRWVFVPDEHTISYGYKVKSLVEAAWKPPQFYAHLAKGGHLRALETHLKNHIFFRVDFHHFFDSISANRITRNLNGYMSFDKAREIAKLSTVPNPKNGRPILPFGFVQSPVLASLCLHKSSVGKFLCRLSTKGYLVTVYVDDIIVSSQFSQHVMEQAYRELLGKIERSGFTINAAKSQPPLPTVTAFNIQCRYGEMKLTTERLTKFTNIIESSINEAQIDAIQRYIRMANKMVS